MKIESEITSQFVVLYLKTLIESIDSMLLLSTSDKVLIAVCSQLEMLLLMLEEKDGN